MSLFKESHPFKEFATRASLAFVMGLGVAAVAGCTDGNVDASPSPSVTDTASPTPNCLSALDSYVPFHFTELNNVGGINIVNTGECVQVYDLNALPPKVIGQIATGSSANIKCHDLTRGGLQVRVNAMTGVVGLAGASVQEFEHSSSARDVAIC